MLSLSNFRKRLSQKGLERSLRRMTQPDNTFFVIVMPGGFHIARLAIDSFPSWANLVVIGNGVDKKEADWAARSLPVAAVVRTRAMLMHHDVLDVIFSSWDKDFGILDYDCFVFDEGMVRRLVNIDEGRCMNAAFFRANEDPPLKVPETFLLFFNVRLLRSLMQRYGVGTRPARWHQLGTEIRERLASVGVFEDRLPESHKPYFDTLRLLMMLACAEGHPYGYAAEIPASPAPSDIAFHVGGVSDPRSVQGIWALRGSYFWRRVLERSDDAFLKSSYAQRFGEQTAEQLLAEHAELAAEVSPEFFAFCDRVLEGSGPSSPSR
jgi:hypothetical protein